MATGMLVHDMIYLPFATKWYNSTLVLSSWFYPNENLWKMFKDPKRSFSGPLKLLMSFSKIYEKSLKIFFRTFEALEDHVTDLRKSLKIFFRTLEALEDLFKALWKILEDLLQDLWSSWRSCQRSMKNPRGSFKHLRILLKMKNPWRYLKFLLRS